MQKTSPLFEKVTPDLKIDATEQKILEFWRKENIFEKSVGKAAPQGPYTFYDGPPFATGLPHYGHILAGTLKDIVPRYWTMKGYSVPRRFGWDCHGVPVEFEINKSLNLNSRQDILNYGVDRYNEACRGIVHRYSEEWKKTVHRMGRWVDMEKPYFTMDPEFMQSVWWVFQELFKKGLIYEGFKVVPYSTGISTALSNFEANLNYKEVQDPAATVKFRLLSSPNTYFLAWTTTPWTLPSNLALAVGSEITYGCYKNSGTGEAYWIAEALAEQVLTPHFADYVCVESKTGEALVGLKYEPLFPFFADVKKEVTFQVITSKHVTTQSGTGIVHMAPAFGEDDFFACQKVGIPVVSPLNDDCEFTAACPPYQGLGVKEADKPILRDLKAKGLLFKQDTLMHSYPFCYRSEKPLIYRAIASWFVAVEKIKPDIIAANKNTSWIPEHLRDGRFGNWLEDARDWAISRNRFWGTPLPIWRNAEGELMCIGSIKELEEKSGQKVVDLHKHFVDQITIPSPTGKSPLRRIGDVLDCWFESGSMPYAQLGYPFNNLDTFKKGFPAQFIAEGLDQTRGWFYTLTVIGAALEKKSPFQNVIVNGLVLAEDGKKMSKSLKNYPDPMKLVAETGADAIRLYLIDSPVVKAQEMRFSEKGVKEVVRRILLRWWNATSFFVNYANTDGFAPKGDFANSPNILDHYILSRLHRLALNTEKEMAEYRLYNVVPGLLQFVEELTNTYIRFNRTLFWQEGFGENKRYAFETLFEVLVRTCQVMAPFAPFLSEEIYQNLKKGLRSPKLSVHLEDFPQGEARFLKPELEAAVGRMDTLVMLARNYREKIAVKAKIPLKSMVIIHRDPQVLAELRKLEEFFKEEINVQQITYNSQEDSFVQISAKANFPRLGPKLGATLKQVAGEIAKLGLQDILTLEQQGSIQLAGHTITFEDVEIRRSAKNNDPNLQVSQQVSLAFDPTVEPAQLIEGLAREVMRKIQLTRRSQGLELGDRIELQLKLTPELLAAAQAHLQTLQAETLAVQVSFADQVSFVMQEQHEIDEQQITVGLKKV